MIKITSTIGGANVVAQFDTIEEYIAYEKYNNKGTDEWIDPANKGSDAKKERGINIDPILAGAIVGANVTTFTESLRNSFTDSLRNHHEKSPKPVY